MKKEPTPTPSRKREGSKYPFPARLREGRETYAAVGGVRRSGVGTAFFTTSHHPSKAQ